MFSILENIFPAVLWAQSCKCRAVCEDFKPFWSAVINATPSQYQLSTQLQNILTPNSLGSCPFLCVSKTNSFLTLVLFWQKPKFLGFYLSAKKGLSSLFGFCPGRKSFWSLINHHSNNFRPKTLFPLTWLQLLAEKIQKQNKKTFFTEKKKTISLFHFLLGLFVLFANKHCVFWHRQTLLT